MNKKQIGLLRANPTAKIDNNLKLPNNIDAVAGKDVLEFTTAGSTAVTAFTFQTVSYALPAGLTASNVKGIRNAIWDILRGLEVNPEIKVVYSGGVLKFYHTGEGVVASVTVGGTARATTRKSTWTVRAKNKATVSGALAALSVNGVLEALVNTPYAYSGVLATDEATGQDLEDDIIAAMATLTATGTVSVTLNFKDEGYDVVIDSLSSNIFKLGATTLSQYDFTDVLA